MLLKSKIYLKPGEKPPKGLEVKRGPKGGLYYETKLKVVPKVEPLKTLHWGAMPSKEVLQRLSILTQDELHSLINVTDFYTRSEIAKRIDQNGLHQLIHDKENVVREEVAKRIDQSGLHEMLQDDHYKIVPIVARRIDQKGLHILMHHEVPSIREIVVQRIDIEGLKEMALGTGLASDLANRRLRWTAEINEMITHYNKTEEIELPSKMKKEISKIIEDESGSKMMIDLIDEFYKHTPFGDFHQDSKSAWERSSSAELSGLLKDSILRQFGGKVRHHDAITDWKKFTEDLYAQYPKEMVDKYVQTHKKLTRKILDVMFPDQDEIELFRGTTWNEVISEVKWSETVALQGNPLSSWTQRRGIAEKFANKENGVALKTLVHKDDIWSTFMSHAYQGLEREFLVISPKDRRGTVVKC